VAPITRGERMVAAGWVRSYVRDTGHRELLFDLETARRRLFDREGKTAEGDLLAKCAANLARLWCDD
jgi:PKHD-type hydroxylase